MIEHIQKQLTVPSRVSQSTMSTVCSLNYSLSIRAHKSAIGLKPGAITMNHKPCKPKDKTVDGDLIDINVDFTGIDNEF